MITTASKYFLGISVVALIGWILYGISTDWGALGFTSLLTVLFVSGFLVSITSYTRDSTVSSLDEEALATGAAAQAPAGDSPLPLIGAFGAAVLAIGAVTYQVIFMAGIVTVLLTVILWTLTTWSERASSDGRFNAEARGRFAHTIEVPLLAAAAGGVIAYSLSRIMLAISPEAGAVVFGVVAALVLLAGAIFSKALSRKVVAALCGVALVAVVSGGVAGALTGERDQLTEASEEDHFNSEHRDCTSPDEQAFDEDATRAVGAKANVAATVTLRDGELTVERTNTGDVTDTLTISRSNVTNILFRNEDSEKHRLTISLGTEEIEGTEGATHPVLHCTALVGEEQVQLLTFTPEKPSAAFPDDPFQLFVPGVEGAMIPVEVT